MALARRTVLGVSAAAMAAAVALGTLTECRAPDGNPPFAGARSEAAAQEVKLPAQTGPMLEHEAAKVGDFLDQNCTACHSELVHKAGVRLDAYKDMASIRADRKRWARVLTMVQGEAMPPPPKAGEDVSDRPVITKDQRKAFVSSAKSVLDYVDLTKPDPGRVTMRRLNRAEYNNTVRELLGISFDPAADFPPDDVGGGFDNNGDVLSISPLLMERYFTASESVIEQALPEGGNWPVFQKIEKWLPAQGEPGVFVHTLLGREKFRHLLPGQRISFTEDVVKEGTADEKEALRIKKGNGIRAENRYPIEEEGDYILRAMAYRMEGGGLDLPTMDIEVDDKVVGTFKVEVVGYDGSIFYKTLVHLTPGPHKMSIAWPLGTLAETPHITFDPTGKTEPPGLHVRWLEVVGPRAMTMAEKTVLAHAAGESPRDAAREVIERFATRAYRRPATAEETGKLLNLYDEAAGEGLEWADAVRRPIQAVIVSPQFLFRAEPDDQPEAAGEHAITDYQLASRLSYFLWSSMPDDELMALAAKNELHNHLEEQTRRMLADPRAGQLTENFASQWLHLRMLAKVTPDTEIFPEYTVDLRNSMATETLKFFGQIVKEDRSILDLLDANFTYLNESMADLYGIVDTKGNRKGQANPVAGGVPIKGENFVRVELQPGDRAGVLMQASVLTVTSNPGRTSPVKRGKFVLEQILGEPPPPPPPNVPSLDVNSKAATTGNVRQRMEKHREDPQCAACHREMDAIGFAFEHYDPIGKYRTMDGVFAIDATGTLPSGARFDGAVELTKVLRQRKDAFADNFAREMMTYALGRQMQYFDKPAVDKIVNAVSADQYKFSRLVVEIVKSDPFRMRRGKDQVDE